MTDTVPLNVTSDADRMARLREVNAELLAALKDSLHAHLEDGHPETSRYVKAARAAIAKAEAAQ